MYDTLLVPLDGSSFGERALPYALAVARRTGARIELVHVHELPVDVVGLALDPQSDEEARERARGYLESMATALAERSGIPVGARVVVGHPVPTIEAEATAVGAGMIVMSTHGRGRLARAWLGSVAEGLVREVELPVLMVRPHDDGPAVDEEAELDRIVVALDGSSLSERILRHAAALGDADRTQYTLLRVVPSALVVGGYSFHSDLERVQEVEASARAYLEGVVPALEGHAADVRVLVVQSESPAAAILDVAEETGADVIAMTTHGFGGLKRLVLGSVSDKVLRAGDVPVLIYRPGD